MVLLQNDDLPKRKQIRLKGYDYSQNGYYFVTICTYGRQRLFADGTSPCVHAKNTIVGATLCDRPEITPGKMIEKWLSETENKFPGVKICEYVIMPEHIHFILSKTGDHAGSPLQDIVGWFKAMTTNEYIANVKSGSFSQFDKKIWQRGYYEHIIRNEADYIQTAEYIINNPLKSELT